MPIPFFSDASPRTGCLLHYARDVRSQGRFETLSELSMDFIIQCSSLGAGPRSDPVSFSDGARLYWP